MSAPDSYRLRVLKALTAELEGITLANGYDYDLPGKVGRGRALYGNESLSLLPLLSIIEPPKPSFTLAAGENGVQNSSAWLLFVQGWVPDNKMNPLDPAYQLMAAVEKRLGEVTSVNKNSGDPEYPDRYLLGGLVGEMKIGPGLCHPPTPDVSSKAFFFLPVEVGLVYDVRDPYRAPND